VTLVRWHRPGFRCYWRWKSRPRGGATADRHGAARLDPADERRKIRFGARHASTANCSSSGLRSRSRALPSTWSNGVGRQAKDGAPFCVVMRRALRPWTYSLAQRLASNRPMPSSSFG
jgi:hypothetical protein